MKTCTKCGETKPLGEFYRTMLRGKPYIKPSCKQCAATQMREHHKTNVEKHAARKRKYYKANTEAYREREWKLRKANPMKKRKRDNEWRKANPRKIREYDQKQRERLLTTYGKENLGAARSATNYFKKHGTMEGWHYEPRKPR